MGPRTGRKRPGAFIGAFVKDWGRSYRLGSGEYMVLEGDEYDTAFFDKGPKFLHYQPYIGIVTSIEFDHADIFSDLDAILKAFRDFVRLIPERGYLILNADDPNCYSLASECKGHVITYGRSHRADWHIKWVDFHSGEVSFQLRNPGTFREETFRSRLPGRHNVWNLTAVIAAASIAGMTLDGIQEAVLAFNGVKRRQEVIGEFGGVLVVDDFAHHPTSVHETLARSEAFLSGAPPDRRFRAQEQLKQAKRLPGALLARIFRGGHHMHQAAACHGLHSRTRTPRRATACR